MFIPGMMGILWFCKRGFGCCVCNMAGTMGRALGENILETASDSFGTKVNIKSKTRKVCHHGPTNTFIVATPIGDVIITSCPKGLHCITQGSELTDNDFLPDKGCKVELKSQLYSDNGYTYNPSLQCIQWLQNYFSKERNDRVPTLCPSILHGGSFTTKVWQTLIDAAPFGTTISYKNLSIAAGKSNASRAVGQAMAGNPIMLVIPCHRVIRSDGAVGNYAHGRRNSVKQWLLKFERDEI